MKVKHVILAHVSICVLLVAGCRLIETDGELTRKIIAWQETYPDRKGDCGIIAMKRCEYYRNQGIRSRFCHGTFKGEGHAWCEYYDSLTDSWLVDDPAIWYINRGYPREAYRSGGKQDYVLSWFGEEPIKEKI